MLQAGPFHSPHQEPGWEWTVCKQLLILQLVVVEQKSNRSMTSDCLSSYFVNRGLLPPHPRVSCPTTGSVVTLGRWWQQYLY